jgi:hypothetical protein
VFPERKAGRYEANKCQENQDEPHEASISTECENSILFYPNLVSSAGLLREFNIARKGGL